MKGRDKRRKAAKKRLEARSECDGGPILPLVPVSLSDLAYVTWLAQAQRDLCRAFSIPRSDAHSACASVAFGKGHNQ